jgi:4-hydroxy-tetrahydrodipicolinate synthase
MEDVMNYAKSDAKRAARKAFTGIWAAVTTPFGPDGRVNHKGLEADIDFLTGTLGVGGIFCAGAMGEFWALTTAERTGVIRTVVEASQGRCPVLAHTGHHSARDTIELSNHAREAGADFAVVMNPYYPAGTEEGLYAWFRQVLEAVGIGVWLFDTSYAGTSLPLELINRLADVDNVCGIKVGHDHARYLETLAKVGDRILVCEPNEAKWLENIREHGQRVYMSSASPYLYQTASCQPMNDYTNYALAGDYGTAEEIFRSLDPVRELAGKWTQGQWIRERVIPVAPIKAWSGLLGMAGGEVRPPFSGLSDQQLKALARDLKSVGLIS